MSIPGRRTGRPMTFYLPILLHRYLYTFVISIVTRTRPKLLLWREKRFVEEKDPLLHRYGGFRRYDSFRAPLNNSLLMYFKKRRTNIHAVCTDRILQLVFAIYAACDRIGRQTLHQFIRERRKNMTKTSDSIIRVYALYALIGHRLQNHLYARNICSIIRSAV